MAEADLKKGLTNPLPVDLTDDCTRLLGQLCYAGSPIDPRTIRALAFLTDKIDVSGSIVDITDKCSRQLGVLCYGGVPIDPRQIRALTFLTDSVDISGSSINSTEYPINAALGVIPGATTGNRTGVNDNVPFANAIILSNVTSVTFPSNQPIAAQQMQVVSTSASDTGGGIGTQQVTITYLTAPSPINIIEPFKKKTETITMTGLAPVLTTAIDIYRIDRFVPTRVGSTGVAIGNISLQNTLGTITYERIDAGRTNANTAAHYIEKGFGTLITGLDFGCTTTGGTILFLIMSESDSSGNHVGVGQLTIELANTSIVREFITPKITTNPDGKEVFVIMAVRGRAANQSASGSFDFVDYPL